MSRRGNRKHDSLYRLDHLQVVCGDHAISTATVKIITPDGAVIVETATGTGPVDAAYKAIDKVVGVPVHLNEYVVQAVTAGIDALGEVTVRVQHEGHVYSGQAANTDVVASARAYVTALNRLIAARASAADRASKVTA